MRTAILILALSLCALTAATAPQARPNIVYIMVDDLGAMDTGFAGSRFYETPNMDRVAREGMVFRQSYSNGPSCSPTRAALMSGQYAPRTGVYSVYPDGPAKDRALLPVGNRTDLGETVTTWAEHVQAAGYTTGMIGKWHLGSKAGTLPTDQGFLSNIAGSQAGRPKTYFSPYNLEHLVDGPKGEHLTDRLAEEAVNFITANAKRPFCLYYALYAVHTPIQPKPEWTARFKDRAKDGDQNNPAYAGLVFGADLAIGRVLATLDALDLADNTVVVVTSDNGGAKKFTSNAPLRDHKGSLYEGGIRVPMAVRWPGRIAAGSTSDVPVITVDAYPTLLALTGATPAKNTVLDGVNLLPHLLGGAKPDRDALYWHFPCYLDGGGENSGKQEKNEVKTDAFRTRPVGAIRLGTWKLIEYFEDGRLELYDLATDPGEQRDLAQAQPKRRDELLAQLRKWREQVQAPMPKPNPAYNQ